MAPTPNRAAAPAKAVSAQSTPERKKVVRSWNEEKLKGSPSSRRIAHKVNFVICRDKGVLLSLTTHPTKPNHEGFVGKAYAMMKKDAQLRRKLRINYIARRRKAQSKNPNESMPSDPGIDNGFKWNVMAQFVKNEKNCTAEYARKEWLPDVTRYFNKVSKDNGYNAIYEVGDDCSTDPLSCLGDVLVWDDVIEMISEMYENNSLEDICGEKEILELYFGERSDEAVRAINSYCAQHNPLCENDDSEGK